MSPSSSTPAGASSSAPKTHRHQHDKLTDVLRYNLRSVRAYLLKESLDAFWQYDSALWASWFLDKWCTRACAPIGADEEDRAYPPESPRLILNWFIAKRRSPPAP